ncbi:hypothetical protein [Caulobacter segnis]
MIVADLIRLLQNSHPQAVVLIPVDPSMGRACEPVSEVEAIAASRFAGGPAAETGVVRLSGFPIALLVGELDAAPELSLRPTP